MRTPLLTAALLFLTLGAAPNGAGDDTPPSYFVYVAAESEDAVYLVRFDGEEAAVAQEIPVGRWPVETEGPHGLAVAPGGEHWFLSIAHGQPYGRVVKYATETNKKIGEVEVDMFPATMAVSEATGLLYVVNFNLHGALEKSTVSVVDPEAMAEVAQVETGVMPHGARLGPDGLRLYSVGMMDGALYEIDAATFEVLRRLELPGQNPKPTWVQPHPTEGKAYVALNGADAVAEVDLEKWQITRRFETGAGPYNLEVTPDGQTLVVSYKGAATTGLWDLETGTETARIENSRRVTHGVVVSPDGRYAFVSAEGIGGEPGAVDVIDLEKETRVASVDVGKQAGGIAFWKMGEAL